ncbi:LLM class flavin-dependent oxidoreductase [Elizabethkingia sp. JS20170427COW]|uniref:LLM class flavin-dependent oxidoreductase n=1 Tax=Elizabethkingia sp. JS20170427COW TaxID=2583851 RepID=UPI001110F018|nr:LLM class flavin-dependent oxidoreductase [Elizabethkingia sp. JS20170427COW]QCX54144.1 LLM class flavin-dependent oxidoreductase [Elizabethkingia sp. JS20170427COW]
MEFGIGMFGDAGWDTHTQQYRNAATRLHEVIEEVKYADALGIDLLAMGEHHREDYVVSSPETLLAALSTVTQNITLSSGVNVLSSADPVKLYQDYAMIDLISGQRAEIMAGRGSFIESFPLFGQSLHDYKELFTEKLELLLQLQKGGEISWQGKFRPDIQQQTIFPQAERKIPVWIAVGGTPESVYRAGVLGLPIIFAIIGGNINHFLPLVEYYKETYLNSGHSPEEMEIGIHSHSYIADSQEQIVQDYFSTYARQMGKIGKERNWPGKYTETQFINGMDANGALFMGTPEDVAEKIIRVKEKFGITRFVAHLDAGGPSHPELLRSIELYAEQVIPRVKQHFNLA